MRIRTARVKRALTVALAVSSVGLMGQACQFGLDFVGFFELLLSGMPKYVGQFEPMTSQDAGDGWTRHTFDTDGGDGPICINGTPFTVFTKPGSGADQDNVLFYLNGGGACWQDFYFCTVNADLDPPGPTGIFADAFAQSEGAEIASPFRDWSKVYVSYCDGSVFNGDNDVPDPSFPNGPVRYHRGLRNVTAALDLARDAFPGAQKLVIAGSSAGGVGASGFAPLVSRFVFGNAPELIVLNDSGTPAINPADLSGVIAREADWQFGQFYPPSCADCDALGQPGGIVKWRFAHDGRMREGWYGTDGDVVNRFFLNVATQPAYRDLILSQLDEMHALAPDRYKRFVKSGSQDHTALGGGLFYTQQADGVLLHEWTAGLLDDSGAWVDVVEDFIPLPE